MFSRYTGNSLLPFVYLNYPYIENFKNDLYLRHSIVHQIHCFGTRYPHVTLLSCEETL